VLANMLALRLECLRPSSRPFAIGSCCETQHLLVKTLASSRGGPDFDHIWLWRHSGSNAFNHLNNKFRQTTAVVQLYCRRVLSTATSQKVLLLIIHPIVYSQSQLGCARERCVHTTRGPGALVCFPGVKSQFELPRSLLATDTVLL
jgi:hypothetical protein